MNNTLLSKKFPGEIREKKDYKYFLPSSIFEAKKLQYDFEISRQFEQASLVLGKFCAKNSDIPNTDHFIMSYLKIEATQSSKIEGTQTEIKDAFQQNITEIPDEKKEDWQELTQYILAMKHAVKRKEELPLCSRLIKEAHKILLSQVRGKHKMPGEYRKSQNWIGGSRPDNAHFVPPSNEFVEYLMDDLEKFIQDDNLPIPHLIKTALIHYQFETIHPFLDGNGRVGRMLIPLYLLEKKILDHPILYVSDFFERNRRAYYDSLDYARRDKQGVVKWISFFLDGIIETSKKGIKISDDILELKKDIFEEKIPTLGKRAKNAQKLADNLFQSPITTASSVSQKLSITPQNAQILLNDLVRLNILHETTGQKRNRIFEFKDYFDILTK